MVIAFVQVLGSVQSKTAGTSTVLTVGKTVTAGDTLFLGFSFDYVAGDPTVADSKGQTWTLLTRVNSTTSLSTALYRAEVTATGTLATITVTHASLTARAAWAMEASGCGATRAVGGFGSPFTTGFAVATPGTTSSTTAVAPVVDDLWVGAGGWETNLTDQTITLTEPAGGVDLGIVGTGGGGAATNVTQRMAYWIATSATPTQLEWTGGGSGRNTASAGAAIIPSSTTPPPALAFAGWGQRM